MREVLLVRYGEIALKGRNQSFFLDTLARNLQAQAGPAVQVRPHFGRILAYPPDGVPHPELVARLARTFGVVSLSPALEVDAEVEAIQAAAAEAVARTLRRRAVRSFKVNARRADKRFPLSSTDVNVVVGRALQERYGLAVDLHEPDLTVTVEIRDRAYVLTETLPGPGGLPVGTGGRVVVLLSGGIDSPVALWMTAKRGLVPVPVHFYAFPFVSERSRLKVLDLCRVLARSTGPLRVWVAHFTEIQRAIQATVRDDLRVTVMRRMMIRIAERLAAREGALALVTGESVGQVASQTVESIGVIEDATRLPVLRPLIGMDKTEIVARAREIGTYELSVLPYEDCCALFVPAHPRTHPRLAEVEAQERGLAVDDLVADALARSALVEIGIAEAPVLVPALS